MSSDATRYRADYEQFGLSGTHKQVIAWVPRGSRVLELGCSSGYIGRILVAEKGCRVTGVEVDSAAASEARDAGLEVLEGSVGDAAFRQSITGPFDIVIAADVLEHLPTPEIVLEHMKQWLAPGGKAIVAVPNLATWQIRAPLFFRGDFTYTETGILDRTHLHFFTWNTFHELIARQRWTIEETMVEGWDVPGARWLTVVFPLRVFKRPLARGDTPLASARRLLDSVTRAGATTLFDVGHALGRRCARRWPNLCAPHVALLLSA